MEGDFPSRKGMSLPVSTICSPSFIKVVHILNVIKHVLHIVHIVVFAYISGRIWEFCPVSHFRAIIDPRNFVGLRMFLSNVKNGREHSLEKGQVKGRSQSTDIEIVSLNMGLLGI